MNPETTYLQNLDTIERIAAFVARRAHLNADETSEFVQVVCVRLFENDYAIIRKFKGDSRFSTYLTTVIGRIYSGCRVEMWGKWRPSAEARRLGDLAITLERLLTRDNFTFDEAVNILTVRSAPTCTPAQLEALYLRLPLRRPRPGTVSDEGLPESVAVDGDAEARLEAQDSERAARRAEKMLDAEMGKLGAEDRTILQLRFSRGKTVPEIARMLHLDQKKLYKRLDKLLAVLRRALEAAGLHRADIQNALRGGEQEIHLHSLAPEENPDPGPSNEPGEGKSRGGKGRQP